MFNKMKKVLSGLFLGTLALGFAVNASAANPQFNFLQGDREFLQGRNITAGQVDPTDPVTANPGDTVEGVIYYHNGVANVMANNVRVKVTMPTSATANQFVLNANLSADNAATITDTVIGGQILGPSGLTINSSAPTQLEVVPNSVNWYPNRSQTPVPLLNGQTGDEIFSNQGLFLGDINGCWNYSGYVMFRVHLKIPEVHIPQLKIVKDAFVGNTATPFASAWADKVQAGASDKVWFRITVTNPGTGSVDNLVLNDQLPAGLSYVSNSAQVFNNDSTSGRMLAGSITNPIVLGKLDPAGGLVSKYTVIFAVTSNSANLNCGDNTFVNTVTATGSGLTATAIATAVVNFNGAICQTAPAIVQSKSAWNNSQNANATSVPAKAGDLITYTLTTKNTGNGVATGYVVSDGINDILDYATVVSITNAGTAVDQPSVANRDNQVLVQFPATDIAPGQSIDRGFTVKVKDPIPTNAQVGNAYDYVMYNFYGNAVVVHIEKPVAPQPQPKPIVTPTPTTPSPVLPATGSADFIGIIGTIVTGAYTAWSRFWVKRQAANFVEFVHIV